MEALLLLQRGKYAKPTLKRCLVILLCPVRRTAVSFKHILVKKMTSLFSLVFPDISS